MFKLARAESTGREKISWEMDKASTELDSMMMTMFQVILSFQGDQWTVVKRKNGFMVRKKTSEKMSLKDLT